MEVSSHIGPSEMSLSASCVSVPQKRTLSNLLAGRVVKKPKPEDCERIQEATLQLFEQQQNICSLLREVENPDVWNIFHPENGDQKQAESEGISSSITRSLLVCELRRQASKLGVPVEALGVKMVLERLIEITGNADAKDDEDKRSGLLTVSQRVQLRVLISSSKELLLQGVFCPKLLWQEYRRDQRLPILEVLYHLHCDNILTLKYILESDEEIKVWLVSQLKALCSWTPRQREDETGLIQRKLLSTVVGVLVGIGFDLSPEPTAADKRNSLLCCSVLDNLLFWLLETVEKNEMPLSAGGGAQLWIQVFDASLCGGSVSADALCRFFTHSLTQTLTYKPQLTVSDTIALQNEWTFAKTSRLMTSLFRKLAVIFSVEQLLCHLQQVLETHEVNWKHVLCFLSTLLVFNPQAQPCLKELLSRLLTSAFECYDLENLITAFLLARQGALEGPSIFLSYSDWFKMSFNGSSSYHTSTKKSLVFLLKFLSDLVPFEPPQYLKVHILHPPYVPVKHRNLLMEYVSLAKTRLADLKESVEDMGLYEDVSGVAGPSVQCQAVQDVEKAVALFESTGRIPATVMEASIFRRPYFLTRFLPALLTPRVLPVKADPHMAFIEALKKADKIPAAQYSSYVVSCQKQRQQDSNTECLKTDDDPLEVLNTQLQEFTEHLAEGNEGDMSGQLSRISHTLSVIFPGCPDESNGHSVIRLHINTPPSSELHVKVVSMLLRCFCQCMLDASRANPPNKQNLWASRFVSVLHGSTLLLSSLMHRLWDLFHNQGSSLSGAHILGLAAFVVHLHASTSSTRRVQLVRSAPSEPVTVGEALGSALVCSTRADMSFCVRLCLAAVCYGMCRGNSLPQQQQQEYIISSFYKKLLHLIPRLVPEARRASISADGPVCGYQEENLPDLWSSATDTNSSWRRTAWHLWRDPGFRQLGHKPQYQLLFPEWLTNELRIQRSEDALSDHERQEYQQWACMEFYLPPSEEQGGCGGDLKKLCAHLLNVIMDQHLSSQSLDNSDHSESQTGSCLPDILSRAQELVYEMEVNNLYTKRRDKADVHDFLFDLVAKRCSSSSSSYSTVLKSASVKLNLQLILSTWNRVLLALPAALCVKVKDGEGRTTLECNKLIEHINQHQRNVSSPAGLLSRHLTSHFLKGLVCASMRCAHPSAELNKALSQISRQCPLLLVSTMYWWEHLSPVLSSLWRRLCDGDALPEQLQLFSDCQNWARSFERGPSAVPVASALLLAGSLHRAWQGLDQSFSAALAKLQQETAMHHRQVLVFLFFLCVNEFLSSLLYPQEKSQRRVRTLCSDLLSVLVDSADWLLIFKSNEQGVYQMITLVTTDDFIGLMPWAFYSLLLQQSPELQQRALCCPGFVHTAVLCYISMLQHYLEGETLKATSKLSDNQSAPSQILSQAQQFLLRAVSRSPPNALSTSQLRQLESQCADLDPEVAAALSVHLNRGSLSPEMDFLLN